MDISFTFTTGFVGDPAGQVTATSYEILPTPADLAVGTVLAPFRFWPVPRITYLSKTRIGYRPGCNVSVVEFEFDRPVTAWSVRVNGRSHIEGTAVEATEIAARGFGRTPFGTFPFGQADQQTVNGGSAEITDDDLLHGSNVVAIFGRGLDGTWTPPVRVPA